MSKELKELVIRNQELCRHLKVAISNNDTDSIWLLDAELGVTVDLLKQFEPGNRDEALMILNTLHNWLIVEHSRTQKQIRIARHLNRYFENRANDKQ